MPIITYEDIQSDINRIANGNRSPILCSQPSEAKTPGGLLARPILTSVYKSSHFKNSNSRVSPYTSPVESILCLDSYQSMYSQMLCGLCQNREVVRVGSIFAYAFIHAMRFLEDQWSLLCNDIRTGTINNKITDPSVREAVMKFSNQTWSWLISSRLNAARIHGKGSSLGCGLIPRTWT
ncbi:hypothetical protein H5410_049578 [Solanum commersonii]|uniref:Uncharacterized protein n=1 Tax=Solanum commersonii TaxID=4109 RepID=A0A9J5WUH5_SOLCO|nr:hypothetical protein H5410_049578 [Solanum commersonii]